jgi:hypothetical protein
MCVHVEVKGSPAVKKLQDSVEMLRVEVRQGDARMAEADAKWSRWELPDFDA